MVDMVKKNIAKVLAGLVLMAAISLGGCTVNIEGLDDYVIDIVGWGGGCHYDDCGDYYDIEIDD